MSATATMTVAKQSITTTSIAATPCCPNCGVDLALPPFEETQAALLQAEKQIADLQAQVRLLNQKATAAVDRWADYEDELAKLRSALNSQNQQSPSPTQSQPASAMMGTRTSFLSSGAANRISALLSPRKSVPNLKPGYSPHTSLTSSVGPFSPAMPLSPTPSTDDLMEALSREQSLRLAAEGKLNDTSREVEELSVQLFEQANEMVATERRARAKLEQRVEVLEKRDVDKKRRLDRLESAMGRIERVRALLGQDGTASGAMTPPADRSSMSLSDDSEMHS